MKSGIQYTIGRGFLVFVVLMTLLAGNVQSAFAAPPSNDDFGNATLISATPFSDTIDNVVTTATPKSGEPANDDPNLGSCNNNLAGLATVWYTFVAPATGILTVDTSNSGYNTVVGVWSGTRGNLSLVSCNNDYYDIVPNGTSYSSAYLLNGTTYYIEIAQTGGVSAASSLSTQSDGIGALSTVDQLQLSITFDQVPAVLVGSYDDTDPNWTYSATGWTHTTATGAYANTHSFNSTAGGAAEFNFVGDQFTIYYTTASNGGDMEVDIDNNPTTTRHEFSSTTTYQQTWTSDVLSPGAHRVRLVRSTGTIYVDAIKVTYKVAPVGNIGTNFHPTYQWNQVSGATWYYFWLQGPSGKLYDQLYQSSAICSAGLCAITPSIMLESGSHTWWVQTGNSVGAGPWSSAKIFSTAVPNIPDKPDQVAPTGNIGTNYTPTYTFGDAGGTWYNLYVNGSSGTVINQWFSAAQAGCNGASCSVTPTTSLGAGSYSWWVHPWNSAGYGSWSNGLSFTADVLTAPSKPAQSAPAGSIGANYTPTYTFSDAGGVWYNLYVSGPSGVVINQWFSAVQATCNGSTCSVNPTTMLGVGNYTWWVHPWNSAGYGSWSDGLSFTTDPPSIPGKPTQSAPTGSLGTNYTPTYTFSDAGGTWYNLYVNGSSGTVINQWFSAAQAGCNGASCSVTPTTSLGGGNFTWQVQPWNSAGYGSWSDGLSFTTDPPTIPGKPSQTNPNGNIGTNYTPTYTFSDAGGAWYNLYVGGPSGVVINQWFSAADAHCNGSTCSITPSTSLGGGAHSWWVHPWNIAGYGPWSDGLSFSTTIPTIPAGVP